MSFSFQRINRLNKVLLLINLVLLVYFAAPYIFASQSTITTTQAPAVVIPTHIPTPTPLPPPQHFTIPKIQVSAEVEPVGTDSQGIMQLPTELTKVGWYSLGHRPGERGNAVIAGHLDSATGAGAIFYNLWQLEPGDEMMIQDFVGTTYTYVVTQKTTYEYDAVPIKEIFGPSNKKLLNLITCTGQWNPALHNYSHRMVITSELREE